MTITEIFPPSGVCSLEVSKKHYLLIQDWDSNWTGILYENVLNVNNDSSP